MLRREEEEKEYEPYCSRCLLKQLFLLLPFFPLAKKRSVCMYVYELRGTGAVKRGFS